MESCLKLEERGGIFAVNLLNLPIFHCEDGEHAQFVLTQAQQYAGFLRTLVNERMDVLFASDDLSMRLVRIECEWLNKHMAMEIRYRHMPAGANVIAEFEWEGFWWQVECHQDAKYGHWKEFGIYMATSHWGKWVEASGLSEQMESDIRWQAFNIATREWHRILNGDDK